MIQKISINKVLSNSNNPRLIKDHKFKQLVNSVKEFPEMLEKRPIVVDEAMIVLGGNMRLKACKEAGLKDIWIDVVDDWSDHQKEQFIIKDNVGFGEWDWEILANEWNPEELKEWGLEGFPFEDEVLEAEEDNYEAPSDIQTKIQLGDLITIGEHRLLCGDSTDSDQVAKLMNGEKADMVFTDPPYGINIVKNEKVGADFGVAKKGKYSKVIADDTTLTAESFYNTCVSLGMNKFIIWGGNYFTNFLPHSDGWLIWNKRANTDIRNTFADGEMAWCNFHTPIRIYDQL